MDTRPPNASPRATRREAGLVQRVRASLRRHWPDGSVPRILVACSGGLDSMVLTHVLHSLERVDAISLEIVHVDHGMRGDSGDAAAMVAAYGASLGLPAHSRRLSQDVLDSHHGTGAEEALRRERYRVFAEVAARIGADAVALAHHQRDQAETVLLHLMRGSGLQGASGMQESSAIRVPWWKSSDNWEEVRLWRPLLSEPYQEIQSWHRYHGLPVAEDETNEDRQYRRNAIRHDVLPMLESVFPGATGNLARFARIAGEDNATIERFAEQFLPPTGSADLPWETIRHQEFMIQRRVVRRWIMDGGFEGELTSDRIEAICNLAMRNRSGVRLEIGSGWSVSLRSGVLSLRR